MTVLTVDGGVRELQVADSSGSVREIRGDSQTKREKD